MECHQNSSNTIDYHGNPLNTITYHWIQCIHQTLPPAHLWKEEIYCRSVSVKTTRKKTFWKILRKNLNKFWRKKVWKTNFWRKFRPKNSEQNFKKIIKKVHKLKFRFLAALAALYLTLVTDSLSHWLTQSLTATLEFWHKEWLLRLETLQTFDQSVV